MDGGRALSTHREEPQAEQEWSFLRVREGSISAVAGVCQVGVPISTRKLFFSPKRSNIVFSNS